jgi:hypothetical protein
MPAKPVQYPAGVYVRLRQDEADALDEQCRAKVRRRGDMARILLRRALKLAQVPA